MTNGIRDEIELFKDNRLLVNCVTYKYLHDFVEHSCKGFTDGLWVKRHGKTVEYRRDLGMNNNSLEAMRDDITENEVSKSELENGESFFKGFIVDNVRFTVFTVHTKIVSYKGSSSSKQEQMTSSVLNEEIQKIVEDKMDSLVDQALQNLEDRYKSAEKQIQKYTKKA